ncbi:CBS domain-containing protein [Methylophaga nitratireducenticrescens]|uniref:Inosine-5'-monophosphate dehydrogenase protein n=1 Tax=Methylophaga nitratireducenticrescens TaxID=754476 RepID=I1XN05_METNJ|nr:CBS domain-containing protein [Methylophaga nitratireducenticrescens]AFI85774.1 CBS domain-containing protein [Methylophaga nitratireducenticrescens]AUZ85497.1 CBS domain-containing protein [Methylophaga nitratireducenticrescens]
MNISEIMNPEIEMISADTTLKEAAAKMERENIGFLVVGSEKELNGTLTDRDIVLRAVSKGKDMQTTTVGDILSKQVLCCENSQSVEEVARHMCDEQVRRMPVINSDKQLLGVVSIGDLAQHLKPELVGEVLKGVTEERHAA